jgi:LytS/YehU family sensor histidine kinase
MVAIAMALPDRPLFGLLTTALLLNPADAVRVGLLEALRVPILVGPAAVLLRDLLPGSTLLWGVASSVTWTLLTGWLGAFTFARRDR